MKLKEIEIFDRPRERLIREGAEVLTNNELIAVLIRSGNQNESAIELANRILKLYPIDKLPQISYYELSKVSGIKSSKACTLLASFELVKRCYIASHEENVFGEAKDIYAYMKPVLILEKVEILYALFFDCKCHLIGKKVISKGRAYYVNFDMKSILSFAIQLDAYGVILVHNHPSGDFEPSMADIEATKLIKKYLVGLEIMLLDHIIISRKGYYSFIKSGILE